MSSDYKVGNIVWEPSAKRVEGSKMFEYLTHLNQNHNLEPSWEAAYRWSLEHKELFWRSVAEFTNVRWDADGSSTSGLDSSSMLGVKWFSGAKLNYAENVLEGRPQDEIAITSYLEGIDTLAWTWGDLRAEVAKVRAALKARGVEKGDRVCGVLVNGPHAVSCMLATASIGAIWSSSSPDFGFGGICDRLSQISPKVLFFSKSYAYGGKIFDCSEVAENVTKAIPSLKHTVLIDHLGSGKSRSETEGLISYDSFLSSFDQSADSIEYAPLDFDDPLYIMFSSGTTGVPKCIVHGVGGTLLQHKKELVLHTDLQAGDKLFYFTTCGWMMWNWMVSALSVGAGIVTFDGSVTTPSIGVLWDIVEKERVKVFGTSPKFLSACMKQGLLPSDRGAFRSLKTILSTGAPLLPEHYGWIYDSFHDDIQLASISGGTDIISCFMLGNPLLPVRIGEIQSRGLGMAVESWEGYKVPVVGKKAELICRAPFVSMPVGFWNDQDGTKFKKAYFDFYSEQEPSDSKNTVWRHGDFIELTPHGGIIVYGRSDATLNPGGVRIGTAEIYRTVEANENIMDSLVVGVEQKGDVDVILFVKLREGSKDFNELTIELKKMIRKELTPRHVPARVYEVQDIPYTRSGKKVELAVRGALMGERATNESALTNPEALAEYYALAKEFVD